MKTRVAVLFGGNSVEHEVSVISAIQAIMSMDSEKYEITPVYIAKNGKMYTGENVGKIEAYKNIDKLIKESKNVIWVKEGNSVFLVLGEASLTFIVAPQILTPNKDAYMAQQPNKAPIINSL